MTADRVKLFFHRIGVLALLAWLMFVGFVVSIDGIGALFQSFDETKSALIVAFFCYAVPKAAGWAISALFKN